MIWLGRKERACCGLVVAVLLTAVASCATPVSTAPVATADTATATDTEVPLDVGNDLGLADIAASDVPLGADAPAADAPAGPDTPVADVPLDAGVPEVLAGACSSSDDCPPPEAACLIAVCKSGQCGVVAALSGYCEDGDACTVADHCTDGVCAAGLDLCACHDDPDCADDGDACNGTNYCSKAKLPWSCQPKPNSAVQCPSAGDTACQKNVCAPSSGQCAIQAIEKLTQVCTPSGCTFALAPPGSATITVGCSDGNACTTGDSCLGGACVVGQETCKCSSDADCAGQEDGDVCNGTLYCNKVTGGCLVNPATAITCPTAEDSACAKNVCYPKSGLCQVAPVEKTSQVCAGGACSWQLLPPGSLSTGGLVCDDGNPCTSGEVCGAGQCGGGTDTCTCKADGDCKKLDDGDLCNGVMYCDKAKQKCQLNPASIQSCPSVGDTACAKNACQPLTGLCGATPVGKVKTVCTDLADGSKTCVVEVKSDAETLGIVCDDGDPCTEGEVCSTGNCLGGQKTCTCNADADCAGKEDGDACNGTLYCNKQTGACAWNPATVVSCPSVEDTACLKNACNPKSGKCAPKPIEWTQSVCDVQSGCHLEISLSVGATVTCEDGEACTKGEACAGGQCQGGVFVCECAANADCLKKDDGNLCNGVAYCDKSVAGAPVCAANPASVVVCKASGELCIGTSCDPASGACVQVPTNDKKSCDDGTLCTAADVCTGGQCVGTALDCNDGSACTNDSCAPQSGCAHFGTNCDDGNGCTADLCDAKTGLCVHDAAVQNAKACTDGDPCTVGDACASGACKSGAPVACPGTGKACTVPLCVPQAGGTFQCVSTLANDDSPCGDGKSCTLDAKCLGGNCKAGTQDRYGLYMHSDPSVVNLRWSAVTPADDGGVVVAGVSWSGSASGNSATGEKYWIGKFSSSNKLLWQSTMPSLFADIPEPGRLTLQAGADGASYLAGTLVTPDISGGNLPPKPFLYKYNSDGTVAWKKLYGQASDTETCTAASIQPGGVTWLAGTKLVGGVTRLQLFQIAPTWEPVWAKDYDFGAGVQVEAMVRRADGSIVLGGERGELATAEAWAAAFSPSGALLWFKSYPVASGQIWKGRHLLALSERSDGVLLAVGEERAPNAKRPWQAGLRANGELWWSDSPANSGRWLAVRVDAGDHALVAGSYQPVGSDAPSAWFEGRDRWGNAHYSDNTAKVGVWLGAAAGPGNSWILVGGWQPAGANNGWHGAILRVDAYGHASCSAAGVCHGKSLSECDDGDTCTVDTCSATDGCSAQTVPQLRCLAADGCSELAQCSAGACPQTDQGRLYTAKLGGAGATFYTGTTLTDGTVIAGGTAPGAKALLLRMDAKGAAIGSPDLFPVQATGSVTTGYVQAIVATADGGYLVAATGRTGDLNYDGNTNGADRFRRLRKFGANHAQIFDLWPASSGDKSGEGDDLVDLGDGTFAWVWREWDYVRVGKLNQAGTFIYDKGVYTPPSDGTQISKFVWDTHGAAAGNGGLWVGGFRRFTNAPSSVWLTRLDSAGITVFKNDQVVDTTGWQGSTLRDLAPGPGGGAYLLVWMWQGGKSYPRILRCDAGAKAVWQIDLSDDAVYSAMGLTALPGGELVITSDAIQAGYDHQCLDKRNAAGQRLQRMFLPAAGTVFDTTPVGGDLLSFGRLADGSSATVIRSTWWGQTGCVAAGVCASVPTASCDDGNVCTADSCAASSGCKHVAIPGCGQ